MNETNRPMSTLHLTTPFNPALWTHNSDIKKDALILLDY